MSSHSNLSYLITLFVFSSQILHLRKNNQVNCVTEPSRSEFETGGATYGDSSMRIETFKRT